MTYSTSCLDRCNHRDFHTCQCNAECEVFGDCCADFQTHCHVNQVSKEHVNYKNLSVCTKVYHNDDTDVGYILSKCPPSWLEPIFQYRCSSLSLNMHVYDIEGYNYHNIYCALCHNHTISDISFWDIDEDLVKECPTDLPGDTSQLIKEQISVLRGKIFRRCFDGEKCPQTFSNVSIINACDSYVYPVKECESKAQPSFRNPHCGYCNGYDISKLRQISCIFSDQGGFLGADMWQFRSSEKSAASLTLNCPVGEIADEISKICRPILCARGYSLIADKCILDNNTDSFNMSAWNCDEEITFILFRGLQTTVSCVTDKLKRHINDSNPSIFKQQASQFDNDLWSALKFTNKKARNAIHIIRNSNVLHDLSSCQINELELVSICNGHSHRCSGQWISGSPAEFQRIFGVSNSSDVYMKNKIYFKADMIFYISNHVLRLPKVKSYEAMLFCAHLVDNPFLNCAMIKLTKEEYLVNYSGLYYGKNKFETDEYIVLPNGHAQICLNVFEKARKNSLNSPKSYRFVSGALDAVHFLLNCLSIMGLFGTLVTYMKLQKLRTFHGFGIICLSLALLFANLLTLLSDKIPLSGLVCIVFAAMTHYFWLAAFSWMTLISIILIDAFVVNRTKPIRKSVKAYSVFIFTGWCTPLLVVLLLLLLQFCASCFSFDIIIYDGDSTCWLATPTINLYAFGFPVVLSLTINLILITTTLISLRKARKISNLLQHKQENEDSWREALLFFKVSRRINDYQL